MPSMMGSLYHNRSMLRALALRRLYKDLELNRMGCSQLSMLSNNTVSKNYYKKLRKYKNNPGRQFKPTLLLMLDLDTNQIYSLLQLATKEIEWHLQSDKLLLDLKMLLIKFAIIVLFLMNCKIMIILRNLSKL